MSEPYFVNLELLAFSYFRSKLSITEPFRKTRQLLFFGE